MCDYHSTPEFLQTLTEDSIISVSFPSPAGFVPDEVWSLSKSVPTSCSSRELLSGKCESLLLSPTSMRTLVPLIFTHLGLPGFFPNHHKQSIYYFCLLLSLQGNHWWSGNRCGGDRGEAWQGKMGQFSALVSGGTDEFLLRNMAPPVSSKNWAHLRLSGTQCIMQGASQHAWASHYWQVAVKAPLWLPKELGQEVQTGAPNAEWWLSCSGPGSQGTDTASPAVAGHFSAVCFPSLPPCLWY